MGNIMRRAVAAGIIIMMVLSMANVRKVNAKLVPWRQSGDWRYYVTDNHAVLGGYEGTKTEVSIPSKLDGYKVEELSWYIFSHTKVKTVTIPSTVERIDEFAFSGGKDNDNNYLRGTIHTIKASKKNKHFTSVGGVLFSKDKKRLAIYPQGKTAKEYKIPSGVEQVGGFAFENNWDLKKVVFPGSVRRVEPYAFSGCTQLQGVSLNNGLASLGCGSFQCCSSLKKLTIPKTVVDMDTRNLMCDGAEQLEAINVHPKNQRYASKDGVLFDKEMKKIYEYPEGKKTASYTVPATVGTVSGMAYNKYLKELTLPPSVKKIAEQALMFDTSLEKVKMASHVEKIGDRAFAGCKSLPAVTVPKNVTAIGEGAFESCTNLKKIVFKAKDCKFFPSNSVIPQHTVVYGYKDSTAYRYAKNYSRTFVNLESKEEIKNEYDADKLLRLLPDPGELEYGEPAYPAISYQDEDGFCGYQPSIIHEADTSRKEYKELVKFTDGLVKGCSTDKQKIEAISNWVHENMTYVLGAISGNNIESVYKIFKNLRGNCMCYTQLTNYMLYLQGIPTVSIIIPAHELGAAFDGERWYVVDSTNGYIGTSMADKKSSVESIIFTSGRLTFDIRSGEGAYLAAVGYNQADQKTVRSITIPSCIKGIYKDVLSYLPKDVTVKGKKGGQVEKFCKKTFKYITYSGSQFSATDAAGNGTGGSPDKTGDTVKLGTKVTEDGIKYKVTGKAGAQKPGTVSCVGYTSSLKGKVKIPASIKIKGNSYQVAAIASKAFQGNQKITNVTIPGRVRTIGSYAFDRCTKLNKMTIPAQVTQIGAYAFRGDKNLKKITLQTSKLTKKNIRKSLQGSSIKTVLLSQSARSKKALYQKIFAASNSGRKVKVQ